MSYRIKSSSKKTLIDDAHLMTRMERLWFDMEEHWRGILVGFVVILAALGVVAGVMWYDHRQGVRASELEQEANRFFSVRPQDNPQQAGKNLKQAIKLYRQVVQEFPRSSIAPQALYRLGIALEQDKNLSGAITAYQDFFAKYGRNQPMVGLIYQRLGYAFLRKGEPDQAERAFSSILKVTGTLNKDYALFELARLEEAQSRPEGAFARYHELEQEYPHSPLVGEARVRMKALGGKEDSTGTGEEGQQKGEQAESPPGNPEK